MSDSMLQAGLEAAEAGSTPAPEPPTPGSPLEAALEVWTRCQPAGYTLPEAEVARMLPTIARHLQLEGGREPTENSKEMVRTFFEPEEGGAPLFQQLLKARGGQVHFLHFWRAFSKAACSLASCNGDMEGGMAGKGFALELETLRDGILRLLEARDHQGTLRDGDAQVVAKSDLVHVVRKAAAMSEAPGLWNSIQEALSQDGKRGVFDLGEITTMIVTWLSELILMQNQIPESPLSRTTTFDEAQPSAAGSSKGFHVLVHIYDVSQEDSIQRLNKWIAPRLSPLKFGGVFHAGVEVNGLEWSFGMPAVDTQPGIACVVPQTHPQHHFRQTVRVRRTKLSGEEIADLISQLIEEYPGYDYDILHRNCCHFADDFCQRLGSGRIPGWVYRLARLGATIDSTMQAFGGKPLLPEFSD